MKQISEKMLFKRNKKKFICMRQFVQLVKQEEFMQNV